MKDVIATWGPVSAAGNSPVILVQDGLFPSQTDNASAHTLQAFITGTATACPFHLYGSTKNTTTDNAQYPADFQDLTGAVDGTTTTMVHIANKPVASVVVVLDSFAGGTSVTFKYIGKRSA